MPLWVFYFILSRSFKYVPDDSLGSLSIESDVENENLGADVFMYSGNRPYTILNIKGFTSTDISNMIKLGESIRNATKIKIECLFTHMPKYIPLSFVGLVVWSDKNSQTYDDGSFENQYNLVNVSIPKLSVFSKNMFRGCTSLNLISNTFENFDIKYTNEFLDKSKYVYSKAEDNAFFDTGKFILSYHLTKIGYNCFEKSKAQDIHITSYCNICGNPFKDSSILRLHYAYDKTKTEDITSSLISNLKAYFSNEFQAIYSTCISDNSQGMNFQNLKDTRLILYQFSTIGESFFNGADLIEVSFFSSTILETNSFNGAKIKHLTFMEEVKIDPEALSGSTIEYINFKKNRNSEQTWYNGANITWYIVSEGAPITNLEFLPNCQRISKFWYMPEDLQPYTQYIIDTNTITEVVFERATVIGNNLFKNRIFLEKVTFNHNNPITLGESCFSKTRIKSICSIVKNGGTIGKNAFEYCDLSNMDTIIFNSPTTLCDSFLYQANVDTIRFKSDFDYLFKTNAFYCCNVKRYIFDRHAIFEEASLSGTASEITIYPVNKGMEVKIGPHTEVNKLTLLESEEVSKNIFKDMTIHEIVTPSTIKVIGDSAFECVNSDGLNKFNFNSVEYIGNYAFKSKSTFNIEFKKSTLYVGTYAFQISKISNLDLLTVENLNLEEYAFYANDIGTMKLQSSLNIGSKPIFGNFPNTTTIIQNDKSDAAIIYFLEKSNNRVIINNSFTSNAFVINNRYITSVKYTNPIITIPSNAYTNTTLYPEDYTSVIKTATFIGSYAFAYTKISGDVIFNANLESLEDGVFYNSTVNRISITEAEIKNRSFQNLIISDGIILDFDILSNETIKNKEYGNIAYKYSTVPMKSSYNYYVKSPHNLPKAALSIEVFEDTPNITFYITEPMEIIPSRCFSGMKIDNLQGVLDKAVEIGDYAFKNLKDKTTSITLPRGLKRLGANAFQGTKIKEAHLLFDSLNEYPAYLTSPSDPPERVVVTESYRGPSTLFGVNVTRKEAENQIQQITIKYMSSALFIVMVCLSSICVFVFIAGGCYRCCCGNSPNKDLL